MAPLSTKSSRFWQIYSLIWLPYAAVYVLIFLIADDIPALLGLAISLGNVLPAALLGIAVVRLVQKYPWPPANRSRFFLFHILGAISYGVATTVITNLLLLGLRQVLPDKPQIFAFYPGIMLWQWFIAFLIYDVLVSGVYSLQLVERLRQEEARVARAEALRVQADLRALRAQLNPHFLFNTLHTLLALVRHEPAAAEEALEQFGDLLHYALRVQQDTAEEGPLGEEWRFVQNYLALESLRLGKRLRLDYQVSPDTLEYMIPVFGLQPLVENSIRHGIAPRAAGGRLRITSELVDSQLVLRVEDDGPGARPESTQSGNGIGLRLVRERLQVLYGSEAVMAVVTQPGKGFLVTLKIPARRQRATPIEDAEE